MTDAAQKHTPGPALQAPAEHCELPENGTRVTTVSTDAIEEPIESLSPLRRVLLLYFKGQGSAPDLAGEKVA